MIWNQEKLGECVSLPFTGLFLLNIFQSRSFLVRECDSKFVVKKNVTDFVGNDIPGKRVTLRCLLPNLFIDVQSERLEAYIGRIIPVVRFIKFDIKAPFRRVQLRKRAEHK